MKRRASGRVRLRRRGRAPRRVTHLRGGIDVSALALWWRSRPRREQAMLMVGAMAVLGVLLWAFVWSPIEQRRLGLIDAVNAAVAERAELDARAAAVAATARSGAGAAAATVDQRSLPALIDADLRRAGLATSIREVAPDGERLRVRLEAVDYRALMAWLDALLARDGLDVARFELRAREAPGQVDAELAFVVPGVGP